MLCSLGDAVRRLQLKVLTRELHSCSKQRWLSRRKGFLVRAAASSGDSGFLSFGNEYSARRSLCSESIEESSPASALPSRRRRKPKPKTPESDKYFALKAAKRAAAEAFVPAYPIPSKLRADPDDTESTLICPGCGIYMQDCDPKSPGYFKLPANETPAILDKKEIQELMEQQPVDIPPEPVDIPKDTDGDYDFFEIVEGKVTKLDSHEFTSPSQFNEADVKQLDETWDHIMLPPKKKPVEDKLVVKPSSDAKDKDKLVVCARCHSLRNYGRVKEKNAENLLPDFDFDLMVGKRLKTAYGRRAVVVMVVDAVDFDGSFPRRVAKLLAEVEAQMASTFKDGTTGNAPRLVIAATKIDLLPAQISPLRLEQWVRKRAIMGGAPRPSAVQLVSSTKGWGIQALTERIMKLAGPRGDVWVVGAQNAGKSSLINALARYNVGREESSRLTEAAHPGTTIGILKIAGLLPASVKLYDTPGILHPHQLTTRLDEQEFKMVQVRKEMKPRTYRIKVGHTLHVGGLLRLDLEEAPAQTIYMTVWASPSISLHMGRTEKAEELLRRHIGGHLQPPLSLERLCEIGRWVRNTVRISGDSWERSSIDIAVAGLGWVSLGLTGEAVVSVWTYDGVAVSTREAMVYDFARIFERPGFTVIRKSEPHPKDLSNAETSFNRRKDRIRKERIKERKAMENMENMDATV